MALPALPQVFGLLRAARRPSAHSGHLPPSPSSGPPKGALLPVGRQTHSTPPILQTDRQTGALQGSLRRCLIYKTTQFKTYFQTTERGRVS